MADIRAIGGMSGSGKTLVLANDAWRAFMEGYRIYSNFDLVFDGNQDSFQKRYAEGKLNYVPLFGPKDLFKIKEKGKFLIVIDEIDVFGSDAEDWSGGVDAYAYRSEAAKLVSIFFKKRLRKMSGRVLYTVQQMRMIPPRVREETEYLLLPKIWKKYETGDPDHPMAPLVILIEEKRISVESGEFYPTGIMRKLVHPIFKFPVITKDMLWIYDTDADILTVKDLPGDQKSNPYVENAIYDEPVFKLAQEMLGKGAMVEQLKNSGRYSKWLGDVLIVGGGVQIVLDVVGVKKRHNGKKTKGKAMQIDLKAKWNKISEMLEIDDKTGSMHFLTFYDIDPENPETKVWKVIPVQILERVCHLKTRSQLSRSKLVTPEKILRVQACGAQPFEWLKDLVGI
jgi:hypothetical protein